MNELFETEDYVSKAMDILIKDFEKKRMELIQNRLSELGISLDIAEEAKRKFKRFVYEIKGNEETLYYNDGSENGLRIITFVRIQNPVSFDSNMAKLSIEYKYY